MPAPMVVPAINRVQTQGLGIHVIHPKVRGAVANKREPVGCVGRRLRENRRLAISVWIHLYLKPVSCKNWLPS